MKFDVNENDNEDDDDDDYIKDEDDDDDVGESSPKQNSTLISNNCTRVGADDKTSNSYEGTNDEDVDDEKRDEEHEAKEGVHIHAKYDAEEGR